MAERWTLYVLTQFMKNQKSDEETTRTQIATEKDKQKKSESEQKCNIWCCFPAYV